MSWAPKDLVELGLAEPEPPSISGLLYPGKRHLVYGDTESGKSWLALIVSVEQILAGEDVYWVDFEMGPADTLARMRHLGLADFAISERFHYVRPTDPLVSGTEAFADLAQSLDAHAPSLVVIDAMEGAMHLHGLDPNSSADVEMFYRGVVDVLTLPFAATLIVDHPVKDAQARGKFSAGSQRKLSAADVGLSVALDAPFGIGRSTVAKITCTKDRPGHLDRPVAARLALRSDPETHSVTWEFREQGDDDEQRYGGAFRPTCLMQRVSEYLAPLSEPQTRNQVVANVTGKAGGIRIALDVLVAEGYLAAEEGPRGAQMVSHVRPYREADEGATVTPLFGEAIA